MTIRIHEADGTPYEHIVEIKNTITTFNIPYNTKYKRLKRTRKQREKVAAGLAPDQNAEGAEESLLYCLGDILQTSEEESAWRLSNWSKEDEEKMSSESYEWIRMDADFEWICKLSINMPGYMHISQLQQDRDVSAQYDVSQDSSESISMLMTPDRAVSFQTETDANCFDIPGAHSRG